MRTVLFLVAFGLMCFSLAVVLYNRDGLTAVQITAAALSVASAAGLLVVALPRSIGPAGATRSLAESLSKQERERASQQRNREQLEQAVNLEISRLESARAELSVRLEATSARLNEVSNQLVWWSRLREGMSFESESRNPSPGDSA